jgi:tetratricopeptide (TPR) repeat protein
MVPAFTASDEVTPLGPLREVVEGLRKIQERGQKLGQEECGLTDDERQRLVDKVKQAGVAALPALLRSVVSLEAAEADWAGYLLREICSEHTRPKIVQRCNALLVDPKLGDDCKARVLGLLADLRAPVPDRVLLRDPDAMLHRSVRDLLCDLDSKAALDQALDLIFEQVPADEFENFLVEVVQHGGEAAQPLLAGLVADSRTPRELSQKLIQWVRPAATRPERDVRAPGKAPARPHMQRALRLLAHGQLGQAHQELLALSEKRQDDPAVLSALGLCLLRLGKPGPALEQLEQAAELAPTVAAHAWNAAVAAHLVDQADRCYLRLQQYLCCTDEREGAPARQQAAATLCDEFERLVADTYPGIAIEQVLESEALFGGAYTALHDARYAAAVEGFRAVLERLPTHSASWRNLGYAYLAQRRPREAARCFSRVLRLSPNRHFARADLE